MNDSIPPPISPDHSGSQSAAPSPINGLVSAFEAILREQVRVVLRLTQPGAGALILRLLALALILDLGYGLVVGTFSGGEQLWVAPLKMSGGLFLSAIICLPSLYILVCLGGARATVVEVIGLVAGLLALMNILLIGFAPVAWVFSQSTESANTMGAMHLLFASISLYFGLRFVKLGFKTLDGVAVSAPKIWSVVFLLVLLQMTTTLRPIVGTADTILPTEKNSSSPIGTTAWAGMRRPMAAHLRHFYIGADEPVSVKTGDGGDSLNYPRRPAGVSRDAGRRRARAPLPPSARSTAIGAAD